MRVVRVIIVNRVIRMVEMIRVILVHKLLRVIRMLGVFARRVGC
jgi:hypothetical protein